MLNQIIGPFFFAEKSVNTSVYQDLLEINVIPQLEHLQIKFFFQEDGTPPDYESNKRTLLAKVFFP